MFDIGGTELLVIGVVALIVVGPKDLPGMFHTLGRFTAKARAMAREFSRAMSDAAKESGVDTVAKDLKGMTSAKSLGLDKVNQAVGKFEAWDPMKKAPQEPGAAKTGAARADAGGADEKKILGPATAALSEERAAAKAKIEAATAKSATARKAAEAAKAADGTGEAQAAKSPATGTTAKTGSGAAPNATVKTTAKPAAAKPATAKATAKPAAAKAPAKAKAATQRKKSTT